MRTVRDIPVFENIPILVRSSLNVPVENGQVTNDYRLRRALLTIRHLSERGAKVVLISQLGERGTETLEPVAKALGNLIRNVSFCPEIIGERVRTAIRNLAAGDVLVLENLRRNPGEKGNDPKFAHELAELADVFVEDSFDTCHRAHASIVSVPKLLPSYAGLLLEEEVVELSEALSPTHPSLAVIGGIKFNTKIKVLETLLKSYDHVFVGGALASDFLKAAGHEVGKSIVSGSKPEFIARLLENRKLLLPIDSVVSLSSAVESINAREKARVTEIEHIRKDEIVLDHGPSTTALLTGFVGQAKTILWNGPLGNYENGFIDATNAFARSVAESGARSVVGGGNTIASIEGLGLLSRFSFVSTGGGAMLDFLAQGTLPGIDALGNY